MGYRTDDDHPHAEHNGDSGVKGEVSIFKNLPLQNLNRQDNTKPAFLSTAGSLIGVTTLSKNLSGVRAVTTLLLCLVHRNRLHNAVEIAVNLNKMPPSPQRSPNGSFKSLALFLCFVDHELKMRWGMLRFDALIHKVGHSFVPLNLYDTSFAENDLDKMQRHVTLKHDRVGPGVPGLGRDCGDHVERHATLEAVSEGKHQI